MASNIIYSRFFLLFFAPNFVYLLMRLMFSTGALITVMNVAVFALAVGVCVAYGPIVREILFERKPMTASDWLALGVFCSWSSVATFRGFSMAWRAMGQPISMLNSDFIAYGVYLSTWAAVFHLAARGALGPKQVPTEKWIRLGVMLAALVFAAIMLGYAFDQFAVFEDENPRKYG